MTNSYVLKKILLITFPFRNPTWTRKTGNLATPRLDTNAPDFYLPLMSLVTFILLASFAKGTSNNFSPEIIGSLTTKSLVWWLLETLVVKGVFYFCSPQSSSSFLELMANLGYTFTGLLFCQLGYVLGGNDVLLYLASYYCLTLTFFLYKRLAEICKSGCSSASLLLLVLPCVFLSFFGLLAFQ